MALPTWPPLEQVAWPAPRWFCLFHSRPLEVRCHLWTQRCNDVTVRAGCATMMTLMMTDAHRNMLSFILVCLLFWNYCRLGQVPQKRSFGRFRTGFVVDWMPFRLPDYSTNSLKSLRARVELLFISLIHVIDIVIIISVQFCDAGVCC